MNRCPPDPVKMAREVLDHLSRAKGEEDTFEGILRGVLPEDADTRQITVVREAVGDLVTQGLLEKITKDTRTLYHVRAGR